MYVEKAKSSFHGVDKLNCAQAILKAFQDVEEYDISDEMIAGYKAFGGGRTPSGTCGAIYAVQNLVDENMKSDVAAKFIEKAKYLGCKEIKAGKTISCMECVAVSAQILQDINS